MSLSDRKLGTEKRLWTLADFEVEGEWVSNAIPYQGNCAVVTDDVAAFVPQWRMPPRDGNFPDVVMRSFHVGGQRLCDNDVLAELPDGYVFPEPLAFSAYLYHLFLTEWGRKHRLAMPAYNVFYVEARGGEMFVVFAWRHQPLSQWHVGAAPLNTKRWSLGDRVFAFVGELTRTAHRR